MDVREDLSPVSHRDGQHIGALGMSIRPASVDCPTCARLRARVAELEEELRERRR